MKNIFFILIGSFFVFVSVGFSSEAKPKNLVNNPGFETNTAGWKMAKEAARDEDESYSGKASIKIEGNPEQSIYVSYTVGIQAKPGQVVEVTAWSRSEGTTQKLNNYFMAVEAYPEAGGVEYLPKANFSNCPHSWEKRRCRFEVTKSLKKMRIMLMYRKQTGTAWFDDISLVVKNKSERIITGNLVQNPGFEEDGFADWDFRAGKGVVYKLDTSAPHAGAKCFMMTGSGKSEPDARILQPLLYLKGGKNYTLRFYVKTKDLQSVRAIARVRELPSGKDTFINLTRSSGTKDWTAYSQNLTIQKNTSSISLQFYLRSKGIMWLDDISFKFVNKEGK